MNNYFTVVIPLYNKEKYIRRAIDSVINQTYQNYELIVIDDGSTDNSADIVKKYECNNITYCYKDNGGVSSARNFGATISNYDWIVFLDADDELLPKYLFELNLFLNNFNHVDISFVGTNYYINNKVSKKLLKIESGIHDYFTLFLNLRTPNNTSSTAVLKKYFLLINGFPEDNIYYEDWITWINLTKYGKFGYISEPLSRYHIVEESVSQSKIKIYEYTKSVKSVLQAFDNIINIESDLKRKYLILKSKNNFIFNVSSYILSLNEIKISISHFKHLKLRYLTNLSFKSVLFFILFLLRAFFNKVFANNVYNNRVNY